MKLILFATAVEAKASLELSKSSYGKIIITGMGSLNAYHAILRHQRGVDGIINIGFAGAFDLSLPLGSLHEVSLVEKREFASHPLTSSGKRLLSSDRPLRSNAAREKYASRYDLVDMEGFGVALAAKRLQLPVTLIKCVTDHVSDEPPVALRERALFFSKVLSERLKLTLLANN